MSSASRKVLVVDTDEIVVALISHILHRQGYMVDVALAAEDAAQRLAGQRYDAILIEWKVFSSVSLSPHHFPSTILLGNPDGNAPQVHSVLRKPIEFGSLVETVADCVK
ncbi:MAG TPA: response regulator [Thermoanaerobaculia bacterium]